MTDSSIIAAQSPKLNRNISSRFCGVWLFITSRENTAANGMLALSLTCMILFYVNSAYAVLKKCTFSIFLLMNDAVFPVQLISFLFLKHLLIVKNSKFKESRFHHGSLGARKFLIYMDYFVIVVIDRC